MTPAELLTDSFGRIRSSVLAVLDGLDPRQLAWAPSDGDGEPANPVGWLVWHLLRIQDDHVAGVAGTEQVWTTQGFAAQLALPLDDADTGYGHDPDDVAAVAERVNAAVLAEYAEAVHAATVAFLAGVGPGDLDRVVDHDWDPPVTLGVRLVSVVDDDTQHVGQAAYVRGLLPH